MRDYIPDPLERGEANAEAWAAQNWKGIEYRCPGCERWCNEDDMHPSTPDPFSLPICGKCVDEYMQAKQENVK